MELTRIKELEALISPKDALTFGLIKNDTFTIIDAIKEHGITETLSPEFALEFAFEAIPENILTLMLREHGYQPIPERKQLLRENALSY
jgi:hypothetical protein